MKRCYLCDFELPKATEIYYSSTVQLCKPCAVQIKQMAGIQWSSTDEWECKTYGYLSLTTASIPVYPFRTELALVDDGKHWKVGYLRLETMINDGCVNARGTALTRKGKKWSDV